MLNLSFPKSASHKFEFGAVSFFGPKVLQGSCEMGSVQNKHILLTTYDWKTQDMF